MADAHAAAERKRLAAERAAGTAPRALYEDAALVEALERMIRTGGSYRNAGLAAGLSKATVEDWISEACMPCAPAALVEAVGRLTRARGLAATDCESAVHAGEGSRALWLERMDREQWSRYDRVSVDTTERPLTREEFAAMMARNRPGPE